MNLNKKEKWSAKFWSEKGEKYTIEPSLLYKYLEEIEGIGKYYPGGKENEGKVVYVQRQSNNIIKPITRDQLIKLSHDHIKGSIKKKDKLLKVENAFHKTLHYFNESNLSTLPVVTFNFKSSTKSESAFYFENCYVSITSDEHKFSKYPITDGYLWQSQLIPAELEFYPREAIEKDCEFLEFLWDVTRLPDGSKSEERLKHLVTILGYLLLDYNNPAFPKAVIFMDSSDSEMPQGGSGKGLLYKALAYLRKVVKEDGKLFKSNSEFAFQQVTADTKLLVLDDVPSDFNFEKLFSVTTDGIPVNKKYQDKYTLPFESAPKLIITTNYSINGEGSSNYRRKLEFELSNYYNDKHSPSQKFGHLLFNDWDQYQWNLFYSCLIHACQDYLEHGILKSKTINLEFNKLKNATCIEFANFSKSLITSKTYNKHELFNQFYNDFPDNDCPHVKTFTKWIKSYASIYKLNYNQSHSGNNYYFELRK